MKKNYKSLGSEFSLLNWEIKDIVGNISLNEFKILLSIEDNASDNWFEKVLDYFIENEFYEYACVVRDEIKRREGNKMRKPSK
ncbi:hypothetical protein ABGT15_04210 [Flavobacterium enshiense]|uniref:hypothetical protein n=1 Tax=Flavobacterium enshiense TaxID=1341165 RepID=UPI00345CF12E